MGDACETLRIPVLYFADPLAPPLTAYKDIFSQLQQCTDLHMMMDIMEHRRYQSPLQSADSQLCGLFCIYIAHHFYSSKFPFVPDVNELQLLAFLNIWSEIELIALSQHYFRH